MLISVDNALRYYALCRQAERSVLLSLGYGGSWDELAEYYDNRLRTAIRQAVAALPKGRRVNISQLQRSCTHSSFFVHCVKRLFSLFPRLLGNVQLSPKEVLQIAGSLDAFLSYLEIKPAHVVDDSIQIRTALGVSCSILDSKLAGSQALRVARRVEHLRQSPNIEAVSIEGYLAREPNTAK